MRKHRGRTGPATVDTCESRALLSLIVPGETFTLHRYANHPNAAAQFYAQTGDLIELKGYSSALGFRVDGARVVVVDEVNRIATLRANGGRVQVDLGFGYETTDSQDISIRFLTPNRGALVGRLFEDSNGDRLWQQREPGVPAKVFLDTNNNLRLDPSEPAVVTDNGRFVFTGLWGGQYRVRELRPGQDVATATKPFTVTLKRDLILRHVNLPAMSPDSSIEELELIDAWNYAGENVGWDYSRNGAISTSTDVDILSAYGSAEGGTYWNGYASFSVTNTGTTPLWARVDINVSVSPPWDPQDNNQFSYGPSEQFAELMMPGETIGWSAAIETYSGGVSYDIRVGLSSPMNRHYDFNTGIGATPGGAGGFYSVWYSNSTA